MIFSNNKILYLLPTQVKTYKSSDSLIKDDPENHNIYQVEFLNRQVPSGIPFTHS